MVRSGGSKRCSGEESGEEVRRKVKIGGNFPERRPLEEVRSGGIRGGP